MVRWIADAVCLTTFAGLSLQITGLVVLCSRFLESIAELATALATRLFPKLELDLLAFEPSDTPPVVFGAYGRLQYVICSSVVESVN